MVSPTIPPHAARLWLEDDSIQLDLPAMGSLHSHRLTFPNNASGLARLLHLVQQRSHESKIGEAGDLTQWQLDRAEIESMKGKAAAYKGSVKKAAKDNFSSAARAGARDVLRRLGLT